MDIYTRTGDDGTTGLLFGGRVRKDDPRPVAYGDVDEAQAAMELEFLAATAEAAADGHWQVELSPLAASADGRNLAIVAGETRLLKDVLVGEVWFASGQSNMDMRMRGNTNQPVIGSNEAILNARNDRIRLFTADGWRSFAVGGVFFDYGSDQGSYAIASVGPEVIIGQKTPSMMSK